MDVMKNQNLFFIRIGELVHMKIYCLYGWIKNIKLRKKKFFKTSTCG